MEKFFLFWGFYGVEGLRFFFFIGALFVRASVGLDIGRIGEGGVF